MEKYLVIIIGIIILYYLHNCWVESKIEKFLSMNKIKEGFGDAVTVDAIDDNNAINILAKVAKDLQEGGGLKVKGALNVDNAANFAGPVNVSNSSALGGPNANLKLNNQGIIFGGPNNGLQGDSAQISAGLHDANSLCVVGMGKTAGERKVTMWTEGGFRIHGPSLQDIAFTSASGSNYRTKNNSSYRIIGGCGPGCASDNSLEIHKYKPDGGWEGLPFSIIGVDTHINGNLNANATLFVKGRNILAEIDDLKNRTIKNQDPIIIRGRSGALDNYYARCNEGDKARDVGISCGSGVDLGDNLKWRIDKA
jgi:hypothetical protein